MDFKFSCKALAEPESMKYNKCVKTGNWFEERALEEDRLKDYLYKRDNGLLLEQKWQKLRKQLLTLMNLSYNSSGYVRYGDKVLLLNTPIVNTSIPNIPNKCTRILNNNNHNNNHNNTNTNNDNDINVLGMHVPYKVLHKQCIPDDYFDRPVKNLSACNFLYAPTRINLFVIRGPTAAYDNQVLRYGQPFLLYNSSEKLVVVSVKQTPLQAFKSGSRVVLVSQCSSNCHFQPLPIQASQTLELQGEPIMANSRILINHINSNENLCLGGETDESLFGPAREVTCRSKRDHHRASHRLNHWCLFLNAPRKEHFPITLEAP